VDESSLRLRCGGASSEIFGSELEQGDLGSGAQDVGEAQGWYQPSLMGGELPWPFWYFDAYIRSWRYLHSRTVGMEMLMGITVFYGAICFVVGSFSDSSPWVGAHPSHVYLRVALECLFSVVRKCRLACTIQQAGRPFFVVSLVGFQTPAVLTVIFSREGLSGKPCSWLCWTSYVLNGVWPLVPSPLME